MLRAETDDAESGAFLEIEIDDRDIDGWASSWRTASDSVARIRSFLSCRAGQKIAEALRSDTESSTRNTRSVICGFSPAEIRRRWGGSPRLRRRSAIE
jgi:hypothetical protein